VITRTVPRAIWRIDMQGIFSGHRTLIREGLHQADPQLLYIDCRNLLSDNCPPFSFSARKPTRQASPTTRIRNQILVYESSRDFYQPTDFAGAGGTYKDLRFVCHCLSFRSVFFMPVHQVISMANITTFYVSSNTEAFHQKPTTFSLVTTLIGGNNRSKRSVFYSHTRSNILKTFSFCEAIMSVRA
jgi:hypothetical protein